MKAFKAYSKPVKGKAFYLTSARNKVVLELDKAVKAGATLDDIGRLINFLSAKYTSRTNYEDRV